MSSDKYIHSKVEDKIYSYWEKNKLFFSQYEYILSSTSECIYLSKLMIF